MFQFLKNWRRSGYERLWIKQCRDRQLLFFAFDISRIISPFAVTVASWLSSCCAIFRRGGNLFRRMELLVPEKPLLTRWNCNSQTSVWVISIVGFLQVGVVLMGGWVRFRRHDDQFNRTTTCRRLRPTPDFSASEAVEFPDVRLRPGSPPPPLLLPWGTSDGDSERGSVGLLPCSPIGEAPRSRRLPKNHRR